MPDIEDLKNMTIVARNLIRARNEYKESPEWVAEVRNRMDNIINEKLESGLLAADAAVSEEMDADTSDAILQFHSLRREIMNFYKAEMASPEFPKNGVISEDIEIALPPQGNASEVVE